MKYKKLKTKIKINKQNNNTTKIAKTKRNEIKIQLSSFCAGQLLQDMGPVWSIDDIPKKHSMEETHFPFDREFQLQIASWIGIRLHVYIPFSVLAPLSGLEPTLVLCAATVPLGSSMRQPHYVWKIMFVFEKTSITSGSCNLSDSSSVDLPDCWREGLEENIPCRTEYYKL